MASWLSKSWWQGTGVLVAILLFGGGIWWQQSRKELSYEIVSQTPLLSLQDGTTPQLQVIFNGKSVTDVTLLVLRVQNTGNIPIPTADFEKPLTFQFGQGIEILSTEITNMKPSNLGASITTRANNVILSPVLFNGGDELLIKVLLSGSNINIVADTRIVGVQQVIIIDNEQLNLPYPSLIIASMIVFTIFVVFYLIRRIQFYQKALAEMESDLIDTRSSAGRGQSLFTR